MSFIEIPLFELDEPDAGCIMPRLPRRPHRQRLAAAAGDRCDYCVRVQSQHRGDGPVPPARTPQWLRTGTDGGLLLLCAAHCDLLFPSPEEVREP